MSVIRLSLPDNPNFLFSVHGPPSFSPLSQHVDHLLSEEKEDQCGQGYEPAPHEHCVVLRVLTGVTVTIWKNKNSIVSSIHKVLLYFK